MLDTNLLVKLIIKKIQGMKDAQHIHSLLGVVLSVYLIQNLQIQGVYIGTIPTIPPSPDPLSGSVRFKLLFTLILGKQLLKAAQSGGLEGWYKALLTNVQLTSLILPFGGSVSLMSPVKIFTPIMPSKLNLKNCNSLEETWKKLIDTFFKDIKNSLPISSPFPAVSTAGGMGTITFNKFS